MAYEILRAHRSQPLELDGGEMPYKAVIQMVPVMPQIGRPKPGLMDRFGGYLTYDLTTGG